MSKFTRFHVPVPGSKVIDPLTVARICGLADSGEIERAAQEVEAQFARGSYGVAPFTVWLAARFARGGPAALPELLRQAAAQIALDEVSRPSSTPEWGAALSWFAENVRSRVRFHTKFHDDVWGSWCAALTQTLPEELEVASGELLAASKSSSGAELGQILEALGNLIQRTFADLIPASAPLIEADEALAPSGGAEGAGAQRAAPTPEPERDHVAPSAPSLPSSSPEVPPPLAVEGAPPVEVRSPPLRLLQIKLSAFERAASEQEWSLAAMLARDIERELGQFDPIRYFPQHFSGYLSKLCEVAGELEMHMHASDSLEAQSLERLYQADPEQFLSRSGLVDSRDS